MTARASSSDELAATIRVVDRSARSPLVLHAPHAGVLNPDRCRAAFTIDDGELAAEHARLVDHATDRMIGGTAGASTVSSALSRFVVDVERFEGEAEEMNAVGMGVLYTHGTLRQPIRTIPPDEAERLLAHFHRYGDAMTALVGRVLDRHGRAVLVDVHSYPARPLPYELHSADRRPPLCIGTDPGHTPSALVDAVRRAFDGWEATLDQPFRGTYVPLPLLGDARLSSVMLEVRRDTYLRSDGSSRPAALREIRDRIDRLVRSV